jgi:Zn-dependent protease
MRWRSGNANTGLAQTDMLNALLNGRLDLVLAWLIAATIAITVHEFAHAKSADLAGDPTPRRNGRLTLNPLAHYDLVGTTLLLLWGMGWAKPVPINPLAFRHPRRDVIWTSLWGPLSNLILAVLFAIPLRLGVTGAYTMPVELIIRLNIVLAVFNLIPIPPLDGSHILPALLSVRSARRLEDFYARSQGWLFIGLIVLVFAGALTVPIDILSWLIMGSRS